MPKLVFLLGTFFIYNQIISQSRTDFIKMKFGTTVLLLIKNDTIWLAADRKVENLGDQNNFDTSEIKIYRTKNFLYAFAGVSDIYLKGKKVFNAETMMKNIMAVETNIDSVAIKFDNKLGYFITKIRDSLSEETLQNFTNENFISFIVAGFRNKKPYFVSMDYKFKKINNKYEIAVHTNSHEVEKMNLSIIGQRKAIIPFLKNNTSYFKQGKMSNLLVCLIEKEAKANPDVVGMPADVFMIYKNGYKEYRNIKSCAIQ